MYAVLAVLGVLVACGAVLVMNQFKRARQAEEDVQAALADIDTSSVAPQLEDNRYCPNMAAGRAGYEAACRTAEDDNARLRALLIRAVMLERQMPLFQAKLTEAKAAWDEGTLLVSEATDVQVARTAVDNERKEIAVEAERLREGYGALVWQQANAIVNMEMKKAMEAAAAERDAGAAPADPEEERKAAKADAAAAAQRRRAEKEAAEGENASAATTAAAAPKQSPAKNKAKSKKDD